MLIILWRYVEIQMIIPKATYVATYVRTIQLCMQQHKSNEKCDT